MSLTTESSRRPSLEERHDVPLFRRRDIDGAVRSWYRAEACLPAEETVRTADAALAKPLFLRTAADDAQLQRVALGARQLLLRAAPTSDRSAGASRASRWRT
jgi:hypothetical protein